ncbi:helix-turn-helix domain-containing protein [Adlercreutzia sp. ZJ141]|uniref:helix-turn-helix domain-containing protein n=1 Tax=Adlercreutzia sp. ZJ141 TaxID=2709406 RepID=UPI0013EC2250|nr:helix-turn-helix transcriptional regulator [Adlercreutzia sp. ZJ141]
MDERQLIGARIAFARKASRLSQVELGRKIKVSGQTVSNWETARCLPNASDIAVLAKTLGCSSDFLLGLSDAFSFPSSGRPMRRT